MNGCKQDVKSLDDLMIGWKSVMDIAWMSGAKTVKSQRQ